MFLLVIIMINFFKFVFKRITIGSLLGIIIWVLLALIISFFKDYIHQLYPVLNQNFNFQVIVLSILGSLRFLLKLFLEFILGDFYLLPIRDYKPDFTLFMQDSEIKQKGTIGDSSNGSRRGSLSKSLDSISKDDLSKMIKKLDDDLWSNCRTQIDMHRRLMRIINQKNIKIFLENDSLNIEVPSSMSDEEASKISKEVLTIDRILNEKISEYDQLAKKDQDINGGKITETTNIYRDACKKFHKSNFTNEKD
uniref:Uncharacterized protein n=1 Tax=Pseudocercospora fijiensis TaxID=1873960 RepID=A0A516EZN0_9PEZI|nr:hypothetical protein [Pseudocercospora fijiensis]QDO71960.1 hypothetical protein [Pseudocercospora fijiensis]